MAPFAYLLPREPPWSSGAVGRKLATSRIRHGLSTPRRITAQERGYPDWGRNEVSSGITGITSFRLLIAYPLAPFGAVHEIHVNLIPG